MRHQAGTRGCFNTQPPEGGWKTNHLSLIRLSSFNTQPPEGGWWRKYHTPNFNLRFQHTAARRRLGGSSAGRGIYSIWFQHTAARRRLDELLAWLSKYRAVSTHSRPKAAGENAAAVGQYSLFQHTAARRRLVSQIAHPLAIQRFNTQPPEGGWVLSACFLRVYGVSTHSRPKAAG